MIAFQDQEQWVKVFDEILRRSRFDLPERTRDQYLRLSFDYVMEFLEARTDTRASALDPVGETNLKLAKTVRREAMSPGGRGEDPHLLRELADQVFPLPTAPLTYVPRVTEVDVPGFGAAGGQQPTATSEEPPRVGAPPRPARPSLSKPS